MKAIMCWVHFEYFLLMRPAMFNCWCRAKHERSDTQWGRGLAAVLNVPGRTLGYAKIAINTQPCYTLSICFELTPFISWIEEEGASIFEGRIHNFIFHGLTR